MDRQQSNNVKPPKVIYNIGVFPSPAPTAPPFARRPLPYPHPEVPFLGAHCAQPPTLISPRYDTNVRIHTPQASIQRLEFQKTKVDSFPTPFPTQIKSPAAKDYPERFQPKRGRDCNSRIIRLKYYSGIVIPSYCRSFKPNWWLVSVRWLGLAWPNAVSRLLFPALPL